MDVSNEQELRKLRIYYINLISNKIECLKLANENKMNVDIITQEIEELFEQYEQCK